MTTIIEAIDFAADRLVQQHRWKFSKTEPAHYNIGFADYVIIIRPSSNQGLLALVSFKRRLVDIAGASQAVLRLNSRLQLGSFDVDVVRFASICSNIRS